MVLKSIVSNSDNMSIRNITSSVFSCIACDRLFQKVIGLKIHQKHYKETKR